MNRNPVETNQKARQRDPARSSVWPRVGLLVLLRGTLSVGPWAQFAPASFWEGFPGFGHAWVATDGPYNEHLVRDVGGLQLGMAVVLLAALARPTESSLRVAALAYQRLAVTARRLPLRARREPADARRPGDAVRPPGPHPRGSAGAVTRVLAPGAGPPVTG